jgi:Zn-dependent M28 family amino/carboxypeptidase
MEAARTLAKYGGALPHTVRFALWGVEEIGLLGSTQYVEKHADELDQFRVYFNMDAAGGKQAKDVVLNEWPDLAPLFEEWQRQMALDFLVGQSFSAHSDHFPFLVAGVPTGGLQPVERDLSGRGYGHTRYDTLDKVDMRNLREAATLAARLALRIASAESWPVARRSTEAVQEMFNKPDYQEERAIMAQIEAHIAAQPRAV